MFQNYLGEYENGTRRYKRFEAPARSKLDLFGTHLLDSVPNFVTILSLSSHNFTIMSDHIPLDVCNKKVSQLLNAESTQSGYTSAANRYDEMAEANDLPFYRDLTVEFLKSGSKEDDCEQLMLHTVIFKFAKYIVTAKNAKNKNYKAGSAAQTLSNFKSALAKRFPVIDQLQPAHNGDYWYQLLYRLVKSSAAKAAMLRGENVSDASKSVFREILQALCLALMRDSGADGYMWRAVVASLFSAVGRASETGTMSWDTFVYNTSLQAPECNWLELKTAKQAPMSFFADAESYHACWIHSMFCYLVSDGANSFAVQSGAVPDGSAFVFPHFNSMKGGEIARRTSEKMHAMAKTGTVPGLTLAHTSQGLKHGAADECTYHALCSMVALVARANWDYGGQEFRH